VGLCFKKCVSPDYSTSVFYGHVELAPDNPRPVFLGGSVVPATLPRCGFEEPVDVVVGGHDAQDLGGGKRALGVHVAPPEDCFDAVQQRQAAVQVQHLPEPGVDALDGVVGARPFAAPSPRHLDEREQRAVLHQPVEPPPRLPQPLVRPGLLAVLDGELLQETVPPRAPRVVLQKPCRGGFGVFGVLQPVGDSEQLHPRVQPRVQGRAALDLVGGVERAPLDARPGPHGPCRLGGVADPPHRRRPARKAAPPLRPRRRLPVLDHLGATRAALRIIQGDILSSGNFFLEKACLNRDVKGNPYTLFETYASWPEPT